MAVRRIPLTTLPTGVLLIFLEQYQNEEYLIQEVLKEMKRRYLTLPVHQLCKLGEVIQNEKLKKVCIETLYEKLPTCDTLLELHSLGRSLQQMSLEQLCHLSIQKNNDIVSRCAKQEISFRVPFESQYQEEEHYQKIKRRKKLCKK